MEIMTDPFVSLKMAERVKAPLLVKGSAERLRIIQLTVELAEQLKRSCEIQGIELRPATHEHRRCIYFASAIAAQFVGFQELDPRLIARQLDSLVPAECVLQLGNLSIVVFSPISRFLDDNPKLTDLWIAAEDLSDEALWENFFKQTRQVILYGGALLLLIYLACYHSLTLAAVLLWIGFKLSSGVKPLLARYDLKKARQQNNS